MDAGPRLQEQVVFHLTGKRSGGTLEAIEGRDLRPALFARFSDLTRLRYDYPLVLVSGDDGEFVRTLSGLVDAALQAIAPQGLAGERLRKSVLRAEREIRTLLREGRSGSLAALWDAAAERLVAKGGEPVAADLSRAKTALAADGAVLDCGRGATARLVEHAWRTVQEAKARRMRREIDALAIRLADLVRADYLRSEAGRHAETLQAGIGARHRALFDFDSMARLLARPSGAQALSRERRERIERVLEVLRAQRFFRAEGGYGFSFDDPRAAVAAFRERLDDMAALVRAMAIGTLELEGRYAEAQHDALFAALDATTLRAEDRSRFPDYLVRLGGTGGDATATSLAAALASGVPLKVLAEVEDLVDTTDLGAGQLSLGAQRAAAALGLNEVFVLQSAASNLYRLRGRLRAAMQAPGPALICTYSAGERSPHRPEPYLVSAAAMQSRAFPAFCYDPGAGGDLAVRFSLETNPQPDAAWPLHDLSHADEAEQRIVEQLPFTFADFAACEPGLPRHFALVPPAHWNPSLVPVGDWLARPSNGVPEAVPFAYAIDGEQTLHKLVVDEKVVHLARQCADAWHRLQELDRPRRERSAPPRGQAAPAPEQPAAAPDAAAAEPPVEEQRAPGEPYIETARCSSCNECVNLNGRMFAYNENKQAFIANPDAGTFRELVEAAESCQVAIIHPGKPRNPEEAGLDELLKRAEPFQ